MLSKAVANSSFSSIEDCISSYLTSKIGSAVKLSSLLGSKGYSKLIDKFGSYENVSTIINSLISTALYVATGTLTVACFATGGAAAIVWAIVSYVIGTFTPGLISTTICLIQTMCGITSTAKLKIRWCCGWGANLYY